MADADQVNEAAPRERSVSGTCTCTAGKGTTWGKNRTGLETGKSPQERTGHNISLPFLIDNDQYTTLTFSFVWQIFSEHKCLSAMLRFSVIKKKKKNPSRIEWNYLFIGSKGRKPDGSSLIMTLRCSIFWGRMLWIPEVYTGSKSNWANLWEKILHTVSQNTAESKPAKSLENVLEKDGTVPAWCCCSSRTGTGCCWRGNSGSLVRPGHFCVQVTDGLVCLSQ